MATANIATRHQRKFRVSSNPSTAQKISGAHVIANRCGRCPAKIWRKCAPQNMTRTLAKKLAEIQRRRTRVQKKVNAPVANTCRAMLQFTAAASGKIKTNQLGG